MVESIVALSILIISFTGIFALLSRSLHNNRVITDNLTATYLAAEGIEVVKNILDHNTILSLPWSSGFSAGDFEVEYTTTVTPLPPHGSGRALLLNSSGNTYSYSGGGVPTPYKRRIRIAFNGSDEMAVNSIVSWTTGQTQSSVNLEDHFFNWRP